MKAAIVLVAGHVRPDKNFLFSVGLWQGGFMTGFPLVSGRLSCTTTGKAISPLRTSRPLAASVVGVSPQKQYDANICGILKSRILKEVRFPWISSDSKGFHMIPTADRPVAQELEEPFPNLLANLFANFFRTF